VGKSLLGLAAIILGSCTSQPDYERFREKVRTDLRDPSSAEFRNEKVRTLWTAGGRRIRLYCAEVNANNAFGGKTGFKPVRYIISAKNARIYEFALTSDPLWVDDAIGSGFYLDCVRNDTQRADDDFGKAHFEPDGFDQSEADRAEPVISNEVAPEER